MKNRSCQTARLCKEFAVEFARCGCPGTWSGRTSARVVAAKVTRVRKYWDLVECLECGVSWCERVYQPVPGGSGPFRQFTDRQFADYQLAAIEDGIEIC